MIHITYDKYLLLLHTYIHTYVCTPLLSVPTAGSVLYIHAYSYYSVNGCVYDSYDTYICTIHILPSLPPPPLSSRRQSISSFNCSNRLPHLIYLSFIVNWLCKTLSFSFSHPPPPPPHILKSESLTNIRSIRPGDWFKLGPNNRTEFGSGFFFFWGALE